MWSRSADELVVAQRALSAAEPAPWEPPPTAVLGACFVCFERGAAGPGRRGERAWAAATALRGRRVLADAVVRGAAGAPYEAGLLALREGPLLEEAVRALAAAPDVLLVDATGRDHPRGAGLALHLGAVLGLPTVGVTDRPLLAAGAWPEDARGATAPLLLDGRRVAAWVRTRAGARPVAIHAGWRTDVDTAVAVVLGAARGHRAPEPLRRARRLARTARARPSAQLYLDQNYLSGIVKGKPAFRELEPVLRTAVSRGAVTVVESDLHELESRPRPDLGLLELLRELSAGARLPAEPDPAVRDAQRRLASTIARELPERHAQAGDETDLQALAAALPRCDLVACDAFMADVIRRTRLDLRHGCEVFSGRRVDVLRLRDRLLGLVSDG